MKKKCNETNYALTLCKLNRNNAMDQWTCMNIKKLKH